MQTNQLVYACKVTRRAIPEDTRHAILDAAWDIMAAGNRADVSMADIAARAGVSRQTRHLAVGDRAGLLHAMLRRKDRRSPEAARLYAFSERSLVSADEFLEFLNAWLDYLPIIYPVGIQLDAAALNDQGAAAAWDDRMKATLLRGFAAKLKPLAENGLLVEGWTAERAAEFAWSMLHPVNWRLLVVECGWSAKDFRASRLRTIRQMLFGQDPGMPPA